MTSVTFDREKMRRIHLIGGFGAGKTTLAIKLADILELPVYHLDKILRSEGGYGPKRPLEARQADISSIAAQPAWITEGYQIWWTDQLLDAADVIIWVDVSWWTAAWHIAPRYWKKGMTDADSLPTWHKIARMMHFLYRIRKYYYGKTVLERNLLTDDFKINRITTIQFLAAYTDKLIRYTRPSQVDAFVASLQQEQPIRLLSSTFSANGP
jgi:adenylate kinase family enzyme